MKQKKLTFGKIFWPSFVAVLVASIVGSIIFVLVVSGIISSLTPKSASVKAEANSVLHVRLNGIIGEKTTSNFDVGSMKMNTNLGLSDLLHGLEKAKTDKNVQGIFLELGNVSCGYATAKEIRNAINDFEKSGKFVVAYNSGEFVGLGKYYISSAADELYGFPTSTMEFLGLGGELTFFKKTFDKLDVDVEIIRGKNNDFKSAVEPFFLEKMSDSSRLQMQVYVDNIWKEMRQDIATDRKLNADDLNRYADEMSIKRVKDAVELKLMDDVKYRDEVINIIKKKVKLNADTELKLVEFEKYAKSKFRNDQILMQDSDPNVAVIIAEGDVSVDGKGLSSNEICKLLRDARANKTVKTVVLRINSPGGSALASDEIWREVKLTNEKKKVIVSMGDLAASGGYYIATPAARIFAEPTTITGSIGVFGMIPYTGDFMKNNLGLSFDYIQTNKHAAFSLNRKLTPEELSSIQSEVDDIYVDFLNRVAEGRGMTAEEVNKIARGRVWTGSDAVKIGLVDELGGLKEAIDYAVKNAGIKEAKVLYYPLVKEDPLEALLEQIDADKKAVASIESVKMPAELVKQYEKLAELENMTGIQMRLPFVIDFK